MFEMNFTKSKWSCFLEGVAKTRHKSLIFKATFMLLLFLTVLNSPSLSAKAAWYTKGPIIHACGRYNGISYTNSLEALRYSLKHTSYKLGCAIEIDFGLTSDGKLVCVHDWSYHNRSNGIDSTRRMTFKQFKESRTKGKLTTMSAYQAIALMSRYPNSYLVVDTKEKGTMVYKRLVQTCRKMGKSSFLRRIVIQLYNFSDYNKIKKVYPFKHWCFSAYKYGFGSPSIIKRVIRYSRLLRMEAVILPASSLSLQRFNYSLTNYRFNKSCLQAIKYGRVIPIICHTVNSKSIYKKLRRVGVINVYSDIVNLNQ